MCILQGIFWSFRCWANDLALEVGRIFGAIIRGKCYLTFYQGMPVGWTRSTIAQAYYLASRRQ